MNDLRTLAGFAAPYRGLLALCALLMLAESAAALAVPWLGGRLAGALLPGDGGGATATTTILVAMLALFAVQALLRFANAWLSGGASERIVADLKVRLYDHLQALPLAFFQQRRHGETLALLTRDVYVVGDYLSGTAVSLVPLLFTVAGALLLMFRLQPSLTLLAMIAVPLFYLVVKIAGRRLRPLAAELQDEHAAAIAIADENLGLLPAIKSFTREPTESARYREQIGRVLRLTSRQLRLQAALGPALQFVAAAGIVALLWLAGAQLAGGALTPAELVSFLLYALLLTRPVSGLADVYGRTQSARGALVRLVRALDEAPEPPAHAGATLPPVRGDIAFEGVSFAYPGRAPALANLTLRIAAGETVAIVGPNGAGKSTLVHLLLRFHERSGGTIAIDGHDIANVSLASLRRQIGVVPQHVLLFNASVRDNIAYGRVDASDAQIERAARLARAHDFIVALPDGYDTLIGDRGVRLSGGQQQRVALARALVKDPPIVILDEATAMFDPQGESEFLDGAREALAGRTVLLITHRPASLAVADRVVRLEGGRVARGPLAIR
ncbi:MAG: ABC transporter ATP-binding protein [Burkholderiales bacterium]|nr:ABC transporter ATP-binding protein [Burkholderiales bacterium]